VVLYEKLKEYNKMKTDQDKKVNTGEHTKEKSICIQKYVWLAKNAITQCQIYKRYHIL
jgi:hypothetical protein